jgi:hypothetical protein
MFMCFEIQVLLLVQGYKAPVTPLVQVLHPKKIAVKKNRFAWFPFFPFFFPFLVLSREINFLEGSPSQPSLVFHFPLSLFFDYLLPGAIAS